MSIARTEAGVELPLLCRATVRISGTIELDELFGEAAVLVGEILKCDACAVYLRHGDYFILRASSRSSRHAASRVSRRILNRIVAIAEPWDPVVIPESAYRDPRYRLFNPCSDDTFETLAIFPLVISGQLRGFVNVQGRVWHQFTQRQIASATVLIALIAIQIGLIVVKEENLSLVERLESCDDIEKANTILRRDLQLDQAEAYRLLQRESRERRMPMKYIAAAILAADGLKTTFDSVTPPCSASS